MSLGPNEEVLALLFVGIFLVAVVFNFFCSIIDRKQVIETKGFEFLTTFQLINPYISNIYKV